MAKFFRDPAVATALEAVSVVIALILGLYTFGALLYVNHHHGWGIALFIIGSVLAICVLLGVGFVPVRGAVRFVKQIRIVFPSDEPPEHQELLDIAQEDAENPGRHLLQLKVTIADNDLSPEQYRPWIELGFSLYNGGVHDVLVGPATGHMIHRGNELPEAVTSEGLTRKPRGNEHIFKVRQVLPKEVAADLWAQLNDKDRGNKIHSLGVERVRLRVQSEAPDGKEVEFSFSGSTFAHDG